MDSILDSLTWVEGLSPGRKARRTRRLWLKRIVVLLCAVVALGVLLLP